MKSPSISRNGMKFFVSEITNTEWEIPTKNLSFSLESGRFCYENRRNSFAKQQKQQNNKKVSSTIYQQDWSMYSTYKTIVRVEFSIK